MMLIRELSRSGIWNTVQGSPRSIESEHVEIDVGAVLRYAYPNTSVVGVSNAHSIQRNSAVVEHVGLGLRWVSQNDARQAATGWQRVTEAATRDNDVEDMSTACKEWIMVRGRKDRNALREREETTKCI
jgi:hypothetical protein